MTKQTMKRSEWIGALNYLGLTQTAAGRMLGVNQASCNKYSLGLRRVPFPVARFLRLIIAAGIQPRQVFALLQEPDGTGDGWHPEKEKKK